MNRRNHDPWFTKRSQELRRNMTKHERHLWYDFLKGLPVTVNRQKVLGRYIADFYCASAKLVIELDGSQHETEEGRRYDQQRDRFLTDQLGLTVLRYPNRQIDQHFQEVCQEILGYLKNCLPDMEKLGE